MFAYCNNEPVEKRDTTGSWSYSATTEIVKESTDGVYYKTTIIIDKSVYFLGINIWEWFEEYAFYYWVLSSGIIKYDNTQENTEMLNDNDIVDKLVEEMMRVAKKQVPNSLSGRTKSGIILELRSHYLGYLLGMKLKHTTTTEIGGTEEGKPGFDYNGDWFEHPLENFPIIYENLLK